jgi:perosamine synthetase
VQPESKQRQRLWRFMALKIIVMRPVLAMMYRFYNARGRDYQDDLANTVRDVVRLKTPRNLRCQPSATLLYEPRKFIDALRAAGFDAADHTRTQHIPAPRDRPNSSPSLPPSRCGAWSSFRATTPCRTASLRVKPR